MTQKPTIRPSSDAKRKGIDYMFFGRRHGRTLRKGRKAALNDTLPALSLVERLGKLPQKLATIHDAFPKSGRMDDAAPVWLEIGFGSGDYLAKMLAAYPNHRFIGCEPFMNGVSNFLKILHETMDEADYADRLGLWHDSAEILLDALPDASIDRLYLLNPDPWPKKRHHKRRFVQPANLDRIARVLKDGGEFITATDVLDLGEWMLEHTLRHDAFVWTAQSKDDWSVMPDDWMVTTRYAQKGADQGRNEIYLRFVRKNRA